ncbi:ABC transporter permease [Pseudonocardia endophytica]|uniref:Transport permease protein n=1 Tax=Pseudonocardia endophytica TaxID=401976 RepID=A0A4V2PHW5_PSEEN|nr:ABC transporter permease [Pseudonocardia endophytica]TCK22306.1 ABC-2 type transport system permease protein [Pseudonocardia endophytica]
MSVDRADVTDTLHRSRVLIRHNVALVLRDVYPVASYLVMPMVLMLVLRPLYVNALDDGLMQVVVGPVVMVSVLSLHLVGNLVVVEREWGTWDRLRGSRASIVEMMLGKAVPAGLLLLAQLVVPFAFGYLVIGLPLPAAPVQLFGAMLLWTACLLSLGYAVAAVVRSRAQMGAVADIGALLLSALGGALLPVGLMPGWAQVLAHVSPGYWAIALMRAASDGDVHAALLPAVVLLVITVVVGAFAAQRFSRRRDHSFAL